MARIFELKDIGPQYAEELAFMGIHSTEDFLKWVSSSRGIMELERSTHIDHHLIENWARQLKNIAK